MIGRDVDELLAELHRSVQFGQLPFVHGQGMGHVSAVSLKRMV